MIIKFSSFEVSPNQLFSIDYSFVSDNEKQSAELIKKWLRGDEYFEFETSGSTGAPKKIIASRNHLTASAKRTLDFFQIQDGFILNCLSVKHIGGAMQVIRALVCDLDLIILEPSSDPFIAQKINWEKISLISFVPFQLKNLASKYPNELLNSKAILLGGASPDAELINTCRENNLTNVYETYGMTETLSHVAIKNLLTENKFQALNGVSFSLDENNCLVIQDRLLEIFDLQTNDIVQLDSEYSFDYLGRKDNVINSGGIKFHPEIIEKKLNLVISNKLLIFSLPHSSLGQCINLVIEGEVDTFEILERIKTSNVLSKFEIPKSIYCLKNFEYTPNQKIKRKETIEKLGL